MNILTSYHGEITIEEKQLITFQEGLPGFEEETKFVLLPLTEDSPFFVLQSTRHEEIAFMMVEAFSIFKDYDITLNEDVRENLQIEKVEDVVAFTILTIQEPFEKTTANLLAPVIINVAKQVGCQMVLTGTDYRTKTPITATTLATIGG